MAQVHIFSLSENPASNIQTKSLLIPGGRRRFQKTFHLLHQIQSHAVAPYGALFLLALLESNTEADVVATVARGVVEALSRTQYRPVAAPGTTPPDPLRARCPPFGIRHFTFRIVRFPIKSPLPNISMHIK